MNKTIVEPLIMQVYKKGDYSIIDGEQYRIDDVQYVNENTINIKWVRDVTAEQFKKAGNQ